MSSPYQILDNRPIDQWKVTELKEELRKRRLAVKGLKEDLVKRLDEAVRIERESSQQEVSEDPPSESLPSAADEIVQPSHEAHFEAETVDNVPGEVDLISGDTEEDYVLVSKDSASFEEPLTVHETTVEDSVVVTESVVSEMVVREQHLTNTESQEENGNSYPEMVVESSNLEVEKVIDDSKIQLETENSKNQLENEYSKRPTSSKEVMLGVSAPENQVYEVRHNLGSPVKSDSISTDSVSINEKIEIKDNIIADNVKLELDNIKPGMVAPSSITFDHPVGGESHPRPMDVEEPQHESNTSIEEKDGIINDTNADLSKKFDSIDDVGDSEKLNLDRSSGDDSMEEDVLESKQVDSKYRPDDSVDGSKKIGVSDVKGVGHVDSLGGDISMDKKGIEDENKDRLYAPGDKRKLNDQALVGKNEPVKKQRRWNTESLKVPEHQSSNLTPTTTPRDTFQSPASKGLSKADATNNEERVVPPSPKSPTNSLRIDRFVRPFTLKAVQELLGKTGNVTSFWMDNIKTHCYVSYSSVEEAVETRNAVFNLQWPPNGGRLLLAEFVEPQEVKTRVESPQAPSAASPAGPVPAVPPTPPGGLLPQPSPRQPRQQQQLAGTPPSLPPPPPLLSNPPQARERLPLPPPPPVLSEKLDPPIVTLDDLFRKTKATPRIYYLPLSEEQVAAKLAAQGKSVK